MSNPPVFLKQNTSTGKKNLHLNKEKVFKSFCSSFTRTSIFFSFCKSDPSISSSQGWNYVGEQFSVISKLFESSSFSLKTVHFQCSEPHSDEAPGGCGFNTGTVHFGSFIPVLLSLFLDNVHMQMRMFWCTLLLSVLKEL